MNIQGKIISVRPMAEGISKQGKAWQKQGYLLETEERYPKQVYFELMNDNISKFNIHEGERMSMDFDLQSNEFNGRFYTDVIVWKVTKL